MDNESERDIRIVVLDRGFVGVCQCPDPKMYALWLPVVNWRTILNWGTTRGLGELVNGPTSSTRLDDLVPEMDIPVRAVVKILKLTAEGVENWTPYLKPAVSTTRLASSPSRTGARNRE